METIALQNTRRIRIDVFALFRNMRLAVENRNLKPVWMEGEPFSDFLSRCGSPKMNPRFWDFWQYLCDSIKETMRVELRVMAEMFPPSPPDNEYRLYFSEARIPRAESNWVIFVAAFSDAARYPTNPDPPVPFIPIRGKAEIRAK